MSGLMWALTGVACGSVFGAVLVVWLERRWERAQRALDYWSGDGAQIDRQCRQLQAMASRGLVTREGGRTVDLRA